MLRRQLPVSGGRAACHSLCRATLSCPLTHLVVGVQKRELHGGENEGFLNCHLSSCKKPTGGSVCLPMGRGRAAFLPQRGPSLCCGALASV